MIQERQPNTNYGLFGYEGHVVDLAIHQDNVADLRECIDRGYIDADSKTLGGHSMVRHCRNKGASKCEKALLKMGWQ